MALRSIETLKREASGYLSSGKIYFQACVDSADSAFASINAETIVTWQCQVCDEINESSRKDSQRACCKVCGSVQKGKLLEIEIDLDSRILKAEDDPVSSPWTCQVCEDVNEGGNVNCSSCGFKRAEEAKEESSWTCPSCTFKNSCNGAGSVCQVCETPKVQGAVVSPSVPKSWYKLSFRSGGSTQFFAKLSAFRADAIKASQASSAEVVSLGVGVSGLFKRHEEKSQAAEASLSTAFSDLDALMRSAGDMVVLASKISDKLAQTRGKSSVADELSSGDRSAFVSLVESLGIEAIDDGCLGSEKADGVEFYDSIARSVSGLVQSLMVKSGGVRVFSLADIYCIYNRTRTTGSLIAPADLLKGARRMAVLNLPVRLHKFTGKGMLCLVPAQDVDPHHLYDLISQIIAERGDFLTAVDLAEKLKISLMLAGQQLAMAESAGKLVRDGQRKEHHLPAFYPNKILM